MTKHRYKTQKVEATCKKGGYIQYTCSVCDYSYKGDEVAATGRHNYNSKNTCTMCALKATAQEVAFDKLTYYIMDRGTYDESLGTYECGIDANLSDAKEEYLVYVPSEKSIGFAYAVYVDGYVDVTSLAIERGKDEASYYVFAQNLYEMIGTIQIDEFTDDAEYIDCTDVYIVADITEEDAAGYTIECISDTLDNYNRNRKQLSIPVTLKELGFKSY